MPGPGSKSLPPDQIEEVQRVVRELVDSRFGGNISAAAEALGASYAPIYNLYHRVGGAGNLTLQRIASFLDLSVDQIMGRSTNAPPSSQSPDTRPIFRNLAGWNEALRGAIRKKGKVIPLGAFEAGGETSSLMVTGPVTEDQVIALAQMWLSVAKEEDLIALEHSEIDREIAEAEARAARAAEIQHEARAKGQTPPDLEALMRRLEREEKRAKKPANDTKPPKPKAPKKPAAKKPPAEELPGMGGDDAPLAGERGAGLKPGMGKKR